MATSIKKGRFLALAFYGANEEQGVQSSTVNLKIGGFPTPRLAAKALAKSKARFGLVQRYGTTGAVYIKSDGIVERV